MRPKKSNLILYLTSGVFAYAVIVLIALHYSAYSQIYPDTATLTLIQMAASRVLSKPFVFVSTPGGNVFSIIIGATLIFAFGVVVIWVEAQRNVQDIARMKVKGSQKWLQDADPGLKKYNKRYTSPGKSVKHDGPNNMVFTKDIYLSMDTRQTRRNLNVLVIGGSGAGKSRFFVKPNLCEMPLNCSFICTDPSGELIASCGKMLEDAGYKIKCFNLVNMKNSNRYNPLKYIKGEDDVIILVDTLLKNTKDPNAKGGDAFWEQAQQMMLQAFIAALWKYSDILKFNGKVGMPKTLDSVMQFMRACTISEKDESAVNATDKMFIDLEADLKSMGVETDFCLQQYNEFKVGSGKTLKSILISAMARFSTFDSEGLRALTESDDISLDKIGDEKTALFIILPTANTTFNFVASMMYSQLFQSMYYHAEKECLGNYVVYDKDGEVVKIFEVPHFDEELIDEDLFAEEKEFDYEQYKKGLKKKSKKKKKKKRQKEESDSDKDAEMNEFIERRDNDELISEAEQKSLNSLKAEDKSEKEKGIKEAEQKANAFVIAAKEAKIMQKGSKFVTKVGDEIIGWYGSAEHAVTHLERLKGCYVKKLGLRLPFHVRFLMDEFANIGTIPDFTNKLATMRKYEISCSIILQNLSQIKKMYEKDYESLMGNCDSTLFLGSDEPGTTEFFNKKLGKTTVRVRNYSVGKSGKGGLNYSYNIEQRDMLTPDEIGRLGDTDECLFFLRGSYPYLGKKYPYEMHRNFKYTSDANFANTYSFKVPKKIVEEERSEYAETLASMQVENEVSNKKKDINNEKNRDENTLSSVSSSSKRNSDYGDVESSLPSVTHNSYSNTVNDSSFSGKVEKRNIDEDSIKKDMDYYLTMATESLLMGSGSSEDDENYADNMYSESVSVE